MWEAGGAAGRWRLGLVMTAAAWIGLVWCSLAVAGQGPWYKEIDGRCHLAFPRDHGPHPGYRTEWWYYTGNVMDPSGEAFGFELTFFRIGLGAGTNPGKGGCRSAWRSRQVFFAHAALACVTRNRFYHQEQAARQALDMAGARCQGGRVEVFVRNWSLKLDARRHRLQARTPDFSYQLELKPLKGPILHGRHGYSRKGHKRQSASCYYSFTRLAVSGSITVAGKREKVSGNAWMDHEFSSAPLETDLAGWDWFSLQLPQNRELMIYLLRQRDGRFSDLSAGTFVTAAGATVHLAGKDILPQVLDHWISPHTGGRYPGRWRLRVPALDLVVTITPRLKDQEVQGPNQVLPAYWEGSVSFAGNLRGRPVHGLGYVEMTGYAGPFGVSWASDKKAR